MPIIMMAIQSRRIYLTINFIFMYDFIFFVMYSHQIKKGSSQAFSRYNGSLMVIAALSVHCGFLYVLTERILRNLISFDSFKPGKVYIYCFVIILFIGTISHYNIERTEKVLNRFSAVENPTSVNNWAKFLAIIFLPLIIGAVLSKK